jgi:hypothetical protein
MHAPVPMQPAISHCSRTLLLVSHHRVSFAPESAHPTPASVAECFVLHPGSLTCTRVSVQHQQQEGAVVIEMEASVHRTEPKPEGPGSALELEEIGWWVFRILLPSTETYIEREREGGEGRVRVRQRERETSAWSLF